MKRSTLQRSFLLAAAISVITVFALLSGCSSSNLNTMTLEDVRTLSEKGGIHVEDLREFKITSSDKSSKYYDLGDGYTLGVSDGQSIKWMVLSYSWDNDYFRHDMYKNGSRQGGFEDFISESQSISDTPLPTLVIESASPEILSYRLDNDTNREFSYNFSKTLHVLKDGNWEPLERLDLNSVGAVPDFTLEPDSTTGTLGIYWEQVYGLLPVGEYQFTDYVTLHFEHSYASFELKGEFSITE